MEGQGARPPARADGLACSSLDVSSTARAKNPADMPRQYPSGTHRAGRLANRSCRQAGLPRGAVRLTPLASADPGSAPCPVSGLRAATAGNRVRVPQSFERSLASRAVPDPIAALESEVRPTRRPNSENPAMSRNCCKPASLSLLVQDHAAVRDPWSARPKLGTHRQVDRSRPIGRMTK